MRRLVSVLLALVGASHALGAPTVKDDAAATMSGTARNVASWATNAYGGAAAYAYGPGTAKYMFALADVGGPGTYKIWVTWSEDLPGYPTNITHSVAAGTLSVEASTDGAPPADTTIGGRPFKLLYEGPITADFEVVFTSPNPGENFQFDAVAVEKQPDPPPPIPGGATVRDNGAGTYGGAWTARSDWPDGMYGADARYSEVAADNSSVWYQQVFVAPRDGIYCLQLTWPAGGSQYATAAPLRLSYQNNTGQSLNYVAGYVNFAAAPTGSTPDSIVANERQFQQHAALIAVLAGETITARVTATAGKRIIADAMALVIVSDLAGNPITDPDPGDEDEDPGEDPGGGPGGGGPGEDPGGPGSGGAGTSEEAVEGRGGGTSDDDECDCDVSARRVYVTQSVLPEHWSVSSGAYMPGTSSPGRIDDFPQVPIQCALQSWNVGGAGAAHVVIHWNTYDPDTPGSPISLTSGTLTIYAGRNGFFRAEWTVSGGLMSQPSYAIPRAMFDSLLDNPAGIPVIAGEGECSSSDGYTRLDCVASPVVSARIQALLARARYSLVSGYQDMRDLIPRSPDQSFDPDYGGGTGGGFGLPTNDPAPEEGEWEVDADGDGVPDYRDEDDGDPTRSGTKKHDTGKDRNFFSKWSVEHAPLKEKFKNPLDSLNTDGLTSENQLPSLTIPLGMMGHTQRSVVVNFNPDGSPQGAALHSFAAIFRALQLLIFTWLILNRVIRIFQSW